MSRAFLKNETADDPVVIPSRAPLPPGVTNYVTPRGLALLRTELNDLETERAAVQTDESDENQRTRLLAELNGRIAALNQRIAGARVVDPQSQSQDVIRFGATVRLRSRANGKSGADPTAMERRFTIVGVDEADASHGLIAFTAPIAKVLQGKKVGETVTFRSGKGEETLEVASITYDS